MATGGPYVDGNTKRRQKKVTVNSDECYSFTIYDSYGDGFCCEYGFGKFWIRKENHQLIKSGNGNFAYSRTKNFCMNEYKTAAPDFIDEKEPRDITILASKVSDELNVELLNAPKNGILFIKNNQENIVKEIVVRKEDVAKNIVVSDLPKGNYSLNLGKEGKLISRSFTIE